MTSNEIAHTNDTQLESLPPAQPLKSHAVTVLQQHADAMQLAYEFADRIVRTDLVPARYRNKPEDATAAILYGAELGLNPVQSLQNVFSVNGSPAIYARTMGALLRARGYRFRTIEKTSEAAEIHAWEPGRDPDTTPPDETARWTIEDAERAKYTSNKKYDTEPRAMLYAKALAEVCRHIAPNILMGIAYSVEDLQLDQPARRQPAYTSVPITVDEILDPPAPAAATPASVPPAAAGPPTSPPPAESLPVPAPAAGPHQLPPRIEEPDEPASRPQRDKIQATFKHLGVTDRDDQVSVIDFILGYQFSSAATKLTQNEADTIQTTLEDWETGGPDYWQNLIREILNQTTITEAETGGEADE